MPEDHRNAVFISPLVPYIEISPDSPDTLFIPNHVTDLFAFVCCKCSSSCVFFFFHLFVAPSQLFWDMLQPSNSKLPYFVLKIVQFLSLNIWYVLNGRLWMTYEFMRSIKSLHSVYIFILHSVISLQIQFISNLK